MSQHLFTSDELKQMGTETVDLVDAAIDAGEFDQAKKLSHRMHKEFFAMHELLRDWTVSLLSFIERRLGDEAVYDALHDAFEPFAGLAEAYGKEDIRRRVQMLAAGLRGHLTSLRIEEDDEKITVMMMPCGSGGRAILNGSYDPPLDFAKIKSPHRMTFGRSDFPVYCAHCALQDIIPIEATGHPIWVVEPAAKLAEEPCKFHFYKDRDKIPAAYYERFGLKKPS